MINDSHSDATTSGLDPQWVAKFWSSLEEPVDNVGATLKKLGIEHRRLDAPFLGFAISLGTAVLVALLLQ